MRVLVTGSRDWTDEKTIGRVLRNNLSQPFTLIHGGARGADRIAGKIATEMGMAVEVYPADWDKHGKAAGAIRNNEMLDKEIDLVIAFPLEGSRGTIHCMRAAENKGIKVDTYGPYSYD